MSKIVTEFSEKDGLTIRTEEENGCVSQEEFEKCIDLMTKTIGILTKEVGNLEEKVEKLSSQVWNLEHEVLSLRFLKQGKVFQQKTF